MLKVTATPRPGARMESGWPGTSPWWTASKAELIVHWGTVVVPLELDVP